MPNDGEGELQPGNEKGVEIHGINPRTSDACAAPAAALIPRAWLIETVWRRRADP